MRAGARSSEPPVSPVRGLDALAWAANPRPLAIPPATCQLRDTHGDDLPCALCGAVRPTLGRQLLAFVRLLLGAGRDG